jgi:V/A-type H+-transporting ATPase subunit I
MLNPKKMKKVRMIVLKSAVEKLIKDLHRAGMVDIRQSKYEGLEEGRPLATFDEVSAQLLKLRSVLSVMESNIDSTDETPKIIDGMAALEKAENLKVGDRLKELGAAAARLSEEIAALENEAGVIEKLLHFSEVDFSRLGTKTVEFRAGELPASKMSKLNRELEVAKGESSVLRDPNSDTTIVFYEKSRKDDVDTVLSELGFTDIEIPGDMTRPAETIDKVTGAYNDKKSELEKTNAEIISLSEDSYGEVLSLKHSLQVLADRLSISSRFSESSKLFVIEGWITAESFSNLGKIVSRYEREAVLEDVKYSHDEMPPTVLNNPKVASPFEFLTNSYSLPNYHEMDPTMLYFLCLPIIYGMIVGDAFYGVASIGLGYLLMQKFRNSYVMYNVSKIWLYSGFPTIVFGILFDEYGGMSHFGVLEYLGNWLGSPIITEPLYEGFHRIAHVLELVILTAAVGMVHLALGFAIGAINEWGHNKKHAFAKIAWIGVEIGMVLALVGAVGVADPSFSTAGLVLLVVSIVTLAATEGIMGIIELPGLVGNILSYTRIAAIGIVGIIIAELLNDFIIPLPSQGVLALVLAPIFLGLHIVNAFIAMFESLVQGGRLNIVEFRSKFLHGGGEVFSPFKYEVK